MASQRSVVIVGGGVIGAAVASFLRHDHDGLDVTVLERDPSYRQASSALSASSIRQQFSTPLNIALSQASLALMQPCREQLGFVEAGYLYLATEAGAQALVQRHALQRAAGADIRLLEPAALRARWPWLATDGIALGSWGAHGEGWFDGPALHQALRRDAIERGARFLHADVVDFDSHGGSVRAAIDRDGRRHPADALLIAAGAWSAPLARRLGAELPVVASKRDVFVLESPAVLPECPLLIDPSGVWLRPESRYFLAGAPPRPGEDTDDAPLDAIDHACFDEHLWPTLATRIPAFEALRVRSAWAGYYEMNRFDHNALVGALPGGSANAFVACGFSGHGMQHALAVGRGMASWIARRDWGPIDLTPLAPDRLARNAPLREVNVI
jgi:FAD-dependent oxidoreductase domain-containing protein 1